MVSTNLGERSGSRVLEGKIAIVTGGSRGVAPCLYFNQALVADIESGIGSAVCQNLAEKGCSLLINYTSDSSAERTEKLAQQLHTTCGVKCLPVQADIGTENGPAHIVNMALNHFADLKTRKLQIDIVINNAGVASKMALENCTSEEFARLPHDRSGRVVNVSSVSASLGFHEDAIYGGTKAALEAMTRTWARELSAGSFSRKCHTGQEIHRLQLSDQILTVKILLIMLRLLAGDP